MSRQLFGAKASPPAASVDDARVNRTATVAAS